MGMFHRNFPVAISVETFPYSLLALDLDRESAAEIRHLGQRLPS